MTLTGHCNGRVSSEAWAFAAVVSSCRQWRRSSCICSTGVHQALQPWVLTWQLLVFRELQPEHRERLEFNPNPNGTYAHPAEPNHHPPSPTTTQDRRRRRRRRLTSTNSRGPAAREQLPARVHAVEFHAVECAAGYHRATRQLQPALLPGYPAPMSSLHSEARGTRAGRWARVRVSVATS